MYCGTKIKNDSIKEEESGNKQHVYCPYCLSENLMYEKEGFSVGQAFAGTVLTGGIGLLAGFIGSKNLRITCLKCGNGFSLEQAFVETPEEKDKYEKELKAVIHDKGTIAAREFVLKKKPKAGLSDCGKMVDCYKETHNVPLSPKAQKDEKKATMTGIIVIAVIAIILYLITLI